MIFPLLCSNYSGRTKIVPASQVGSVCQVVVQIPQVSRSPSKDFGQT